MLLTGSCSANGALLAKHLHRSSSICFALHNARLPSPRLCAKPTATQLRCAGAPRSVVISGATSSSSASSASITGSASIPSVLYVTQLDPGIKGDELTAHFRSQPGFESAFVMEVYDEESGRQQHLGYVQFASGDAAAAAQKVLDGSELRQQRIKVRSKQQQQHTTPAATAANSDTATPTDTDTTTTTSSSSSSSAAASSAASTPDAATQPPEQHQQDEQQQQHQEQQEQDQQQQDQQQQPMSRSKKYRLRQQEKRRAAAAEVPPASPNILFVRNLRQGTTNEQLVEVFGGQPGYTSAFIRKLKERRFDGYVTFESAEAAAAAMQAVSGTSLNDKPLSISLHEGYNKDKKSDKKSDSEKNSGDSGDSGSNESGGGDTAAAAAGSKQQRAGGGSGSSKKPAAAGGGGSNNTQQSVVVSVKVRNLAWSTTADGLAEHFKGCQGFLSAVAPMNAEGRASGVGYVRFKNKKAATAAAKAKDQTELDGRTIQTSVQPTRSPSTSDTNNNSAAAAAAAAAPGEGSWALQVFNLAWETTDQDLVEHFSGCEGYTGAFIVTGRDNRPSGSGWVTFDSPEAQAAALKAKQGSELVGRSMYLRLTGAGRVDRHTVSDGGSGDASTSASQATRIVLMGLPPTWTYREVRGLCSFFGDVEKVSRVNIKLKQNAEQKAAGGGGAGGGGGGDGGEDMSKPTFVFMDSTASAQAAVAALNGHVVQGCCLAVSLAEGGRRQQQQKEKTKKQRGSSNSSDSKGQEAATAAGADEAAAAVGE